MSTHRCDSASKRARFAPIHTPARGYHTPPILPLSLQISGYEMHNPSPYDSGYDSSFSTASGPGKPPSSRGNSDIDDQVDRYIRDQRVVIIFNDPSAPDTIQIQSPRAPLTPIISTSPASSPSNIAHLHTTTTTRPLYSRTATPRTSCTFGSTRCTRNIGTPPAPRPTDISPPAPICPKAAHTARNHHPIQLPATATTAHPPPRHPSSMPPATKTIHAEIPDDARNAIHRRYAQMQTRMHLPYSNPPRLTVAGHTVVDIRVASHDYDSSSIYPDPSDSSDGDTPHYWLETTNPTPPASNLPPPVMITDRQLMEWIESQLLWNIFRQRIPIFRDTPIELCGTPQPPQPYLYVRTCSSLCRHTRLLIRISAFLLHSGLS